MKLRHDNKSYGETSFADGTDKHGFFNWGLGPVLSGKTPWADSQFAIQRGESVVAIKRGWNSRQVQGFVGCYFLPDDQKSHVGNKTKHKDQYLV